MAIIGSFCGLRSLRKQSSRLSPASEQSKTETVDAGSTSNGVKKSNPLPPLALVKVHNREEKKPAQIQDKRRPMPQLKVSASVNCARNPSAKQRLMVSLSMKLPRSTSLRQRGRKEEEEEAQPKQKRQMEEEKIEDSVWMKTIILGERCRVPQEDDTVLYDDKGNKISTYHPRTPRSLPMSRTNSFNDYSTVPR